MKIRRNYVVLIFIILINIFNNNYLCSQVTIGLGEKPEKGTLLQLKEKENIADDSKNAYRGLGLPRVTLSKKDQLYPMFLLNRDEPTSGPNGDYDSPEKKVAEDKKHIGLIVYNLVEDDNEGLCIGLNQWNGKEWSCLQEKMGNAVANIDACDKISFSGQYQNNVSLNSGNYMSITLHVTKTGAYTITARAAYAGNPTEDNGYYFTATGMFLTTGKYTLQVPGSGTPLQYTPSENSGDVITIMMNDKLLTLSDGSTTCGKNVIVKDSSKKPEYTMMCSQTVVRGVYQLDKELDNTNYIEMVLNVDPSGVGATYIIETNTIDGIYFKGQGLLTTAGNQTVTLQGYGVPNSLDTKAFTLTSNSVKTSIVCRATVSVAIPTKVTYGWGWYNNTAGYIMQIYGGVSQGTRAIVDANVNFGTDENSIVKIVKHSPTQTFNHTVLSGELMAAAAYNLVEIKKMFDQKPEIILAGFDLDIGESSRKTVAGYMVDYLKSGGVLILPLERNTMMKAFCEALYPGITVTPSPTLITTSRFQMAFMNDDILNGPFGDIRGKFWGNDVLGAISITGLPEEDLIVYSRDSNGSPLMFRHKYYNLFWCGDGGVFSNYNGKPGTEGHGGYATGYPMEFDTNYVPTTRTGWSGGDVENSRLFANIMAWAIKTAQFNGINK